MVVGFANIWPGFLGLCQMIDRSLGGILVQN